MTPEEFTRQLPPFANDPARSKPPFVFKNLSARVFPLRANINALQQLCDCYLNIVPPEVGRFRAFVPYAYLALLDYGQISEMVSSIGWFAQSEVYFGVPVEWYQVVNGRWTFRDWAVITPFIYVDDDFSVPLGRMVFGFPKTLARVTKAPSEWLRDPVAPVTLARVETVVFPELYKKRRLEPHVFLEVERDAPMANFRIPLDPKSPITPWVVASRLAEAMAGFGRDAMAFAQSPRMFEPHPGLYPGFGPEMLNRLMPAFMPGGHGVTLNSLNIKQFRSSGDPSHFCYQALTNGRMQMMMFNGGGVLGEERVALGDLTGGYTIKLHEYSSLPIARTLGLEVDKRWRGDDVDVASFKPVMPFWANLDVKYLAGTNLAWRTRDGTTRDGVWYGGNGQPLDPSQQPIEDALPAAQHESDETLFNTTVASAVDDAVTGPFEFANTTIRVLPLLAYREKLEELLDTYINRELSHPAISVDGTEHLRLRLWCREEPSLEAGGPLNCGNTAYIYMTASSFGDVTSKTNNVGNWARYELSFLIPVKFERATDTGFELVGVGLVPVCSFVDDTTAAVSRTEVLGIPTVHAKFVRPSSVWLQEGEESLTAKQTLLRVNAEVFTALHVGQQASVQPLLEVSSNDYGPAVGEWQSRVNPVQWSELLRSELGAKKAMAENHQDQYDLARALALELLGNRVPISLYTLKQFRDVADPGKACYQALVRVSRTLSEVFDIREIEETLRVRIHDFPSLQLAEKLGIVADTLRDEGTGVTYSTQAIRPFYLRAKVSEDPGERLISRAGTSTWTMNCLWPDEGNRRPAFQTLLSRDGTQTIAVDGKALELQDQGNPCRMNRIMHSSVLRRRGTQLPAGGVLTRSERRALWNAIDVCQRKIDPAVLRELESHASPEEQRQCIKEHHLTDDVARYVENLRDLKTSLRRPIAKSDAREALNQIDPQMVIESILSREWGNFDENARWRRRRADIRKRHKSILSTEPIAFAELDVSQLIDNIKNAAEPAIQKEMEKALARGRERFADIENKFYNQILSPKKQRPGRRLVFTQVSPMIAQMKKFTVRRLEMECHFSILEAWSVGQESGESDDPDSKLVLVGEATGKLLRILKRIAVLPVIGEPSPDDDVDIRVQGNSLRLQEILRILEQAQRKSASSSGSKGGSARGDQRARRAWLLIDLYREAVSHATERCDAQRDALLNKLSRAYQKPDFCIRRDSVGPSRDSLFPIALSWDADWYYGDGPSTENG